MDKIDDFVDEVTGATNWLARKIALIVAIIGALCILYWAWSIYG